MKTIEGCDWIRRILFVCLFSGPWRALCSIAGLENLLASTVSFVPRDRISGAWDQLRYIRGSLVIGSFIASAKWAKSQGLSLVSTRLGRGVGGFFFSFLPDVFHPSPPPTSKCLLGQVSPVILELCISPLPVVSMPISYAPAARALTLCCFNHSINQGFAVISTLTLTATRKPVTSSGHIISH